ncbi:uncharacterized protein FOMMEDRAFT_78605 [Fomitiporia mediterranea MF3/22]|uniref:uncharacterized protein n=1 Tax=Fomitiporia mediterranea (strain MF3/22) TaxID=694068 RepID=UPI0004408B3C|nr:uncharacterized protein FOMMEDRAFT_78605 [Fomitiporia mediterranea MF3/22]EJD06253.1 hypothetical protein FOMMEDRAFT_78605 [Fomitiporia mediterranea MF3/22]
MKLTTSLSIFASFTSLAIAQFTLPATVNPNYDNPTLLTSTLTCGTQLSSQFPTFGSLPSSPRIGGLVFIGNSDSSLCGTCWRLSLAGTREPHTILLAVDSASEGFVISQEAMREITGQSDVTTAINVDATEMDGSFCGIF